MPFFVKYIYSFICNILLNGLYLLMLHIETHKYIKLYCAAFKAFEIYIYMVYKISKKSNLLEVRRSQSTPTLSKLFPYNSLKLEMW